MLLCVVKQHFFTFYWRCIMSKCIFTTRFKACCKEKGYTQETIAAKLNISVNGLKHYLRTKNDRLPPLDLLKRMAELLDVDVAYLVGEIDCKRYSEQTVYDTTGLLSSIEYVAKKSNKYSWQFCRLVDILADSIYISDFLEAFDDYQKMCTAEVVSVKYEHKTSYCSTLDAEELLKAKVITLFDKIITDSTSFALPDAPEEIVRELSKQLLLMIDTEKVLYKNNYEPLYKKVAYKMEEINKINPHDYISLYTPKEIVHEKNEILKKIYLND